MHDLIKFHGGPYDGFEELFESTDLAEEVACPVCDEDLRLRTGKSVIDRVALYELEGDAGTHQYEFSSCISVQQLMKVLDDSGSIEH